MEEIIQNDILKTLQSTGSGLRIEELAERLNLTRQTVARYLEVLLAGKIHYNKIIPPKLWTDVSAAISIRSLDMDDLEDILRIQKKILREQRSDSSKKLSPSKETTVFHPQHGDPLMNLRAEIDGKLAGFIFSEVRRWEFSRSESP